MIAVVQRVTRAQVTVEGEIVGQIAAGMLVLAAIQARDGEADIAWMAGKLATMRMFKNGEKYFDLDIQQAHGGILLVSNFTVAADTASGRRPSLSNAAAPDVARPMFEQLLAAVRAKVIVVETGRFGAEMQVELSNDGPVTFLLESPVV